MINQQICIRKCLESIVPNNAKCPYNMQAVEYNKNMEKMDRIEKLKAFLESSPKDNFLRHALALEYIKLEELSLARSLFESILTDSPDYVGSYYHLAKLLEKLSENEAAIIWYEKGMEVAKAAKDNHAYNELLAAYEDLVY